MTDSPLSDALASLVRQGDIPAVRQLLDQLGLLDYNLAHDVRMNGAHMAADCQGRVCPPYVHLDGVEG